MPVVAFGKPAAHRARAEGSGLEQGQAGRKESFVVHLGDAGGGELRAAIDGPSPATIELADYENGDCRAEYVAKEPGIYTLNLLLNEEPIPGSPFKVCSEV